MKFFNLITLASLVTAVPQFRRQNSVTRDIKASADELSATVMTTLTTIGMSYVLLFRLRLY
jgi:hypothetical protein